MVPGEQVRRPEQRRTAGGDVLLEAVTVGHGASVPAARGRPAAARRAGRRPQPDVPPRVGDPVRADPVDQVVAPEVGGVDRRREHLLAAPSAHTLDVRGPDVDDWTCRWKLSTTTCSASRQPRNRPGRRPGRPVGRARRTGRRRRRGTTSRAGRRRPPCDRCRRRPPDRGVRRLHDLLRHVVEGAAPRHRVHTCVRPLRDQTTPVGPDPRFGSQYFPGGSTGRSSPVSTSQATSSSSGWSPDGSGSSRSRGTASPRRTRSRRPRRRGSVGYRGPAA